MNVEIGAAVERQRTAALLTAARALLALPQPVNGDPGLTQVIERFREILKVDTSENRPAILVTCSVCGNPTIKRRRPAPGRPPLCSQRCKNRSQAGRDAQDKYRAKRPPCPPPDEAVK